MEQRLDCEIVKDLLPLYIDQMTSSESRQAVEEHLKTCASCREALIQMEQPLKVETAPEITDLKKYLRKSRISILSWIMGAAAGIAVLVCFIVNLALEKHLSWFYIVLAAIITAYFPAAAALYSVKNRFIKGLAVLTVCTPLLLGVIQLVLYQYMGMRDVWFWKIGLPVTFLWYAIVWISAAANRLLHWNRVLSLGVLAALAVPGNCLTNLISGEYHGLQDYLNNFISNGLGNTVLAAILLAAGVCVQIKQKKRCN